MTNLKPILAGGLALALLAAASVDAVDAVGGDFAAAAGARTLVPPPPPPPGPTTGRLALEVPDGCQSDTQFAVEVWMRDLSGPATGFQAFLAYDDAVLDYRGDLSVYTMTPFLLHIQPLATAEVMPGELRLDGSDIFDGTGTAADSLLATIVFDVAAECASTTVAFDLTQLFDSELSVNGVPIDTSLTSTPGLILDDTPPLITYCPPDVTVSCPEDATPAMTGGPATAMDNCTAAPVITFDDDGGGPDPCPTDFDDDGNTGFTDLNAVLANWGPCPVSCPWDLNDDDNVGFVDLNEVLAAWGPCPPTGDGSGCPGDELVITRTWTATDDCGNEAECIQVITVRDETAPVYDSTPADVVVDADVGGCTATLSLAEIGAPTASDDCDAGVDIAFSRSDGQVNLDDPYDADDSPVTITWTAADACGNETIHLQTVTVNAVNTLVLDVELVKVHVPVSRCIHLVLDDCGATSDHTLAFVDHDGDDANGNGVVDATEGTTNAPSTPVRFSGEIAVPCGDWTQVCAKDEQHTLWDTLPLGLDLTGTKYAALGTVSLEPGDNDNDGDVDINDVTFLLATFGDLAVAGGCPYDGTRDADFDDGGAIGSEDYSRLSSNWLAATNCACTLPAGGPDHGGRRPAISILTNELDPWIARRADLDGDGDVDVDDVDAFERRHGLPATLSSRMRTFAAPKQ